MHRCKAGKSWVGVGFWPTRSKEWLLPGTPQNWLAIVMTAILFLTLAAGGANAAEEGTSDTPSAATDAEVEVVVEEEAEAPEPFDPEASFKELKVAIDTTWVMIAGFMVFFMNLGFGCVESGFCRLKNTVNILSKNFVVFAITSLAFWVAGFGMMFGSGEGDIAKYVGINGIWLAGAEDNSPATEDDYKGDYGSLDWAGVPLWCKFFFQLAFAGTAATIVSGAVAERIKYVSFIVFGFIMGVAIYPITGHWVWGGGWLADLEFFDFAGSTVVHSVGGWAALTGIIILGPRIGKFGPDGRVLALPGHNLTIATIGCFVLWFGWFGFNPGSFMGVDPEGFARTAVTTNMAAAAAIMTSTLTSWVLLGKPDLGMTLNGCLAGLVAITAPCAVVSVLDSILIGAIGGVLVVLSVLAFDRAKLDDPVGATSVHLVCGIWGTLAVGIFSQEALDGPAGLLYGGGTSQLVTQAIGIGACGAYVFIVSMVAWLLLKFTIGIRVSEQEELEGLDLGEHGNEAYHGFVTSK